MQTEPTTLLSLLSIKDKIKSDITTISEEIQEFQQYQEEIRNSLIYNTQTKSKVSDMPKGGTSKTDLSDVLSSAEKDFAKMEKNLIASYTECIEQLNSIQRLEIIIKTLPPLEQRAIELKYIEGWTASAIEIELCKDHKTMHYMIKEAERYICDCYSSSISTHIFARQRNKAQLVIKTKTKKKQENDQIQLKGQTSIFDFE